MATIIEKLSKFQLEFILEAASHYFRASAHQNVYGMPESELRKITKRNSEILELMRLCGQELDNLINSPQNTKQ